MNIAVFGLTISSSWGNGHATLWRGLCRGLGDEGHQVTFFERDVPYYAEHRDATAFPGCRLLLYPDWAAVADEARRVVARADAAIVTSYCPDARRASALALTDCPGMRVFYDLDTPVTLERLEAGETPAYLPEDGLRGFDLALSFGGGRALQAMRARLGARVVAPLYGSVDPAVHRPVPPDPRFRADLSYLGTYAADRRGALDELFVRPARRLPERRFLVGGALYPADFPWEANIRGLAHVPPPEHAAFFSSAELSLNITRGSMARWGWCPSGRLFEAAACGVPQISDSWEGLDAFFQPGSEIFVARSAEDVVQAMALPPGDRAKVARAARERVLAKHTAAHRARELAAILGGSVVDDIQARRPATAPGRTESTEA